tara:strand:- start:476 stop:2473 length:1998 start_codon:yes stop_codon:yes gene_type:complete
MTKRAGYQGLINQFLVVPPNEILGELTRAQSGAVEELQLNSWIKQIEILKKTLSPYPDGFVAFEFTIPRIGKRVDNLFIYKDLVLVIEFKVGYKKFDRSAIQQVTDYSLDLKNFHRESHSTKIIPILVATEGPEKTSEISFSDDYVSDVLLSNTSNLDVVIKKVLKNCDDQKSINYSNWINAGYCPTPTIIEASKVLYRGHGVKDISRTEAGADNLGLTTQTLNFEINQSKKNGDKTIFLVTGVPGAGKTLAGLNLACERRRNDPNENEHAVFLSGNGPLVRVLREALTRDARDRGQKKNAAKREVTAFIQNIHNFRDDSLKTPDPPIERIVIFDEAQRAWHAAKLKSFMKKKTQKEDLNSSELEKLIGASEPELLIGAMDRHKGWAAIICLVGGGQEINSGEAGMEEWLKALRDHYPHWKIFIPQQLNSKHYLSTFKLEELGSRLFEKKTLHLDVSLRSFRSEKLSIAVATLLEGTLEESKIAIQETCQSYPIRITRSLEKARKWLRNKSRGSERYGLLTSSGAKRLKPMGLTPGLITEKTAPNWFLNDDRDVRSSYSLEDPATEFQVQGLELDWAGVIWDGDFVHHGKSWKYQNFRGCKWIRVKQQTRQRYMLNAYRVLLTRARQGMVIVVPNGSEIDHTRPASNYDPTWKYLVDIGFQPIET